MGLEAVGQHVGAHRVAGRIGDIDALFKKTAQVFLALEKIGEHRLRRRVPEGLGKRGQAQQLTQAARNPDLEGPQPFCQAVDRLGGILLLLFEQRVQTAEIRSANVPVTGLRLGGEGMAVGEDARRHMAARGGAG